MHMKICIICQKKYSVQKYKTKQENSQGMKLKRRTADREKYS